MKRMGWLLALGFALTAGADPGFIDFEQNWIFPGKLGGMKYRTVEKYEDTSLGYSVFYRERRTSFQAEVSVCNLGYNPIPDGYAGEAIDAVLKGVGSELEWRQKNGKIKRLKKRGTAVVPKDGDFRFASVVYEYVESGRAATPVFLSTYVAGIKNRFIKIRFSFNQSDGAAAKAKETEMISQIAKMVTTPPDEKELLLASCSIFLDDPSSYGGRLAARYLMAKAQAMDNLNVYTHLFAWPTGYYSKPRNADLLIAGYFAGMLQVVVPQNLDEGGEYEAFLAMLKTYETMRKKDQIKSIEKFDEWLEAPDKKALYEKLLIVE